MLSLLLSTALLTVSGPSPGFAYAAGFGAAAGRQSQTNYYEAGPVSNLGEVIQVASGYTHSVALKQSGAVMIWGSNDLDQLGQGVSSGKLPSVGSPIVVPNLPPAVTIAAGISSTFIATANGDVHGWGANGGYQLGYTGIKKSNVPLKIPGITGAVALASGGAHVLALKADGTVWSWGGNTSGELGRGNTTNSAVPQAIPGLTNVEQVAAGAGRSFALKTDGTVWAWGSNSNDALGIPGDDAITVPTQVAGLSLIQQISTSGFHQVALRDDGMVMTWGNNAEGQLGNPSIPQTYAGHSTPTLVPGVSGITRADAGGITTILGDIDGDVWVCGKVDGFFSQYKSSSFIKAPYVEKMVQASPGQFHTLVLSQTETPIWAVFTPYQIVASRQSSTLKITTEKPLAEDLVLPLDAATSGVALPATATLPAGETSVEVQVSHPEKVDNWFQSMVGAPTGKVRAASNLYIAPELLQLQFSDTYGGDSLSGLARLNFPAPPGGLTVALSCDKPWAVKFPETVTIPEGNYAQYFTMQTQPTATLKVVRFTATCEAMTALGDLYILGNQLGWVKFAKPSVQSGSSVNLNIRIATPAPAGGTVVNLLQGGDHFNMPATATVPEGQVTTQVSIGTKLQPNDVNVPLTAYVQGSYPKTTWVNVLGAKPVILTASDPYPVAGTPVTVTLKMSGPSSGQTLVLTSGNVNSVTVPSSITLPVGATEATFEAQTTPGLASSSTVRAKLGSLIISTVITPRLAAPALDWIVFDASWMTGGTTLGGSVRLSANAPAGGAYVKLISSAPKLLMVPEYVKVNAGSRTATFTMTAAHVTTNRWAKVKAQLQGSEKEFQVKIVP